MKRTLQSQGKDGGDFKRARSTALEDGGPKTAAAKAIEDKLEDGGTKAAAENDLTEEEKKEKRKEEAEKKKEEICKAQEAEEKKGSRPSREGEEVLGRCPQDLGGDSNVCGRVEE